MIVVITTNEPHPAGLIRCTVGCSIPFSNNSPEHHRAQTGAMDLIHSRHGQTTSQATFRTAGSASFLLSDVLEHIIFFAIPDSDVGHVDNSQTLRTAPTNASLVNRHWRSVALHSRRLWSAIHLQTESLPVLTRRLSQFSLFLDRCGPNMDLPLDFSIFSRPNEFMEFREKTQTYAWRAMSKADIAKGISVVEGYWDLLLPRRSSWRRVNFSIWARSPMEEVEHRRPWRMDNMKTLEELYIFLPIWRSSKTSSGAHRFLVQQTPSEGTNRRPCTHTSS